MTAPAPQLFIVEVEDHATRSWSGTAAARTPALPNAPPSRSRSSERSWAARRTPCRSATAHGVRAAEWSENCSTAIHSVSGDSTFVRGGKWTELDVCSRSVDVEEQLRGTWIRAALCRRYEIARPAAEHNPPVRRICKRSSWLLVGQRADGSAQQPPVQINRLRIDWSLPPCVEPPFFPFSPR